MRDEADSWKKGEVIKLEGDSLVTIKVEGGQQVSCKPSEAPIQNPDTRGGVEVRLARDFLLRQAQDTSEILASHIDFRTTVFRT